MTYHIFKMQCARHSITEAGAIGLAQVLHLLFKEEGGDDFSKRLDDKMIKAPDEMIEHPSIYMSLYDRLILYKDGSEEPLDGDEVEGFIEMLRADVNKHEGNW